MSAAIEFRDLSIITPDGRRILDSISLKIEESTVTAVLGRSGSGKTTLLRTVNRMVEASRGEVLVHGKSVRLRDLVELRRGMGYVIQETGLFPHFTVERNVALVLEAMGRNPSDRRLRAKELLADVGLAHETYGQRYPHQLSGGQRQRVGVARALAAGPPILLMDEPFGALDPLTRAEMQDMLRALLGRLKKTVLLVTHDLDEALYLADRIVLVSDGRVVSDGSPNEFLRMQQADAAAYREAFHRGERSTKREQR